MSVLILFVFVFVFVDYGFVGSGKGKINLYKGQKLIKRHVDTENAVEELKKLMMEYGEWKAPNEMKNEK